MARDLVVRIVGDSSSLERSLKRSEKATSDFGRQTDRTFRGVIAASGAFSSLGRSVAFASTSFLAGAGLTAAFRATINAASDLNESINAVRVIFGSASDQILRFSQVADKRVGLSMRQLNELITPLGASLQNFGFSAQGAAKESIKLTERAADMASVLNTDVSAALEAIQSLLRGEADPIEQFGVSMNETTVAAEALRLGLAKTNAEITNNDKTLARLSLLYQQTAKFQGDFANTSGGLANQSRIQAASFENLQAKIGKELVPSFQKWSKVMLQVATVVAPALILALKIMLKSIELLTIAIAKSLDIILGGLSRVLGAVAEFTGAIGGTFGRALARIGIDIGSGTTDKIVSAQNAIDGFRESLRAIGTDSQKAALQTANAFKTIGGALVGAGVAVGTAAPTASPATTRSFGLPGPLRLAQARAQVTQALADDVAVAKRIKAFIEARIAAGTLKGQRLIDALGELASANAVITGAIDEETRKRKDAAAKEAEARKKSAEQARKAAQALAARANEFEQRIGGLFAEPDDAQRRAFLGLTAMPDPRQLLESIRGQNQAFRTFRNSLTRLARAGAPGGLVNELLAGGLSAQAAAIAGAPRALQQAIFRAFRQREALARQAAERPIRVFLTVNLDGKKVATSVTTHQQKNAARQGVQRRGSRGGQKLALQ